MRAGNLARWLGRAAGVALLGVGGAVIAGAPAHADFGWETPQPVVSQDFGWEAPQPVVSQDFGWE